MLHFALKLMDIGNKSGFNLTWVKQLNQMDKKAFADQLDKFLTQHINKKINKMSCRFNKI